MNDKPTDIPLCLDSEARCAALERLKTLEREVEKLSSLVRTDTLTGLFNYRHLVQALDREMERSARSGRPTALVALDLDHFKQVNDRWGHDAGNQVLVEAARRLRKCIRKLDIPCRYGGEEIFIILPDTGPREALRVAERIRLLIARRPFNTDQGPIEVTVSLGFELYEGYETEAPGDFVRRADSYLYQAKQAGRNCCCHPPLPETDPVNADEKQALFDLFRDRGDP